MLLCLFGAKITYTIHSESVGVTHHAAEKRVRQLEGGGARAQCYLVERTHDTRVSTVLLRSGSCRGDGREGPRPNASLVLELVSTDTAPTVVILRAIRLRQNQLPVGTVPAPRLALLVFKMVPIVTAPAVIILRTIRLRGN